MILILSSMLELDSSKERNFWTILCMAVILTSLGIFITLCSLFKLWVIAPAPRRMNFSRILSGSTREELYKSWTHTQIYISQCKKQTDHSIVLHYWAVEQIISICLLNGENVTWKQLIIYITILSWITIKRQTDTPCAKGYKREVIFSIVSIAYNIPISVEYDDRLVASSCLYSCQPIP